MQLRIGQRPPRLGAEGQRPERLVQGAGVRPVRVAAAQRQDAERPAQAPPQPRVVHPPQDAAGNISPGGLLKDRAAKAHPDAAETQQHAVPSALASAAAQEHLARPHAEPFDHGAVIPVSGAQMAELIAGRLAMFGFAGTVAVWALTGWTPLEQALRFPDNVALVSVAVLASSLFVRSIDKGLEVRFLPAFTLRRERLFGQAAMLGCALLAAWELAAKILH